MTTMTTIKTVSLSKSSKSQVALARATNTNYYSAYLSIYVSVFLFITVAEQIKPAESGFLRSGSEKSAPKWQQQSQLEQQQVQQQQYHQYQPAGNYRQQPPARSPAPAYYPPEPQMFRSAAPQTGNPMQPEPNYPLQQQPAPQQQSSRPALGPYGVPIPVEPPRQQQPQLPRTKSKQAREDRCGTIAISEMHGYQVREYKILTKDNYELVAHRLIHPSDVKRMIAENLDADGRPPSEDRMRRIEPKLGHKKPYLLLHGLVGSSASFVRNVEQKYQAPQEVYDVTPELVAILNKRAREIEINWHSSADKMNAAFVGDISNTLESLSLVQKIRKDFIRRIFASTPLIDFHGDRLSFANEFTQAYRKFEMPRESLRDGKFVPNSLAFTLSNFGYDVWLVNLRGNEYSSGFNGPMNRDRAEYWDFNLDKLIKEDLLATVSHMKKTLGWKDSGADNKNTIGIVTYSYSSLHILGLLTKFPMYQRTLQPVIMMAPTLLSKSSKLNFFIEKASKFLISHTGPFPNRAAGLKKKLSIEGIVCSLPVTSKLCNLMTLILHGQTKSVKGMIKDDREQVMMLRDSQCGQTSTGVLHQIVENISFDGILPAYMPSVGSRDRLSRGELRRTIMIIRSQADDIADDSEVKRIKETAIKGMILSDVVINEPKFGHTDFLFSRKNQFLVNAEVARMALVFDYMSQQESANRKIDPFNQG